MAHGDPDRSRRASSGPRGDRENRILRDVRQLLIKDRERASRMRRLERMDTAAMLWINGRPAGPPGANAHLYETYD
jgi:hypothetical protein